VTGDTPLPGTGRLVTRWVAAALGLALATLLVAAALVVVASFRGDFGHFVSVRAVLPAGANAPQIDSPVEYRNVTVGAVGGEGVPVGRGQVSIVLHLKPSDVDVIPRSVKATVGPLSIFGNQYVALQPLDGTTGPTLKGGETIGAIPRRPNASLQATIADFYDVLASIRPTQLDAALTSIATALRGQGHRLGAALHGASQYLATMIPLLPTFEHDLELLAPVADNLRASTPALLDVLSNLAVTGRTIVADEAGLHGLLAGGTEVVGQGAQLLSTISAPLEHLLIDSGPLLDDVAQSPKEIADILAGLDGWSRAWTQAESQGPYLSVSATVDVPNAADLVLAGLGAPRPAGLFADGVGRNLVNPPTYTAADCPSYGSMAGTDCGHSPTSTDAATSAAGSTLGVAQQRAASDVVAGLDGGHAPAAPAVAALLLGPILDDMTAT
jgi:phospholipid/cholesterol/gamma-HCH transport system substrate-binding protein